MDDAQSFADWGVDYLKYDNCYHMGRFGTPLISFERFNKMAEALKATGKNIFYSLCNWGEDYSYSVRFSKYSCHHLQDTLRLTRIKWFSGLRPLVTHGAFSVTSTILSLAQTIFALATIPPTRLALPLAPTVRCSPSSTASCLTSTAVSLVDGTISTCSRLATVARLRKR